MGDLEQLNPKMITKQIGIRKMYSIQIYPLSISDESSFIDKVTAVAIQFTNLPPQSQTRSTLVTMISEFIRNSLPDVIRFVVDMDAWKEEAGDEDLFKHLSNEQFLDLVEAIYDMNFAGEVEKKVKEMFQAFQKKFPKISTLTVPPGRPS